jgi:hypothetical protein
MIDLDLTTEPSLADLEDERACAEDCIEELARLLPDSYALPLVESRLAEIVAEITARGLIGA